MNVTRIIGVLLFTLLTSQNGSAQSTDAIVEKVANHWLKTWVSRCDLWNDGRRSNKKIYKIVKFKVTGSY